MSFSQIKFSDRYKLQHLLHKNPLKTIFRGRNVQTGELVIIKAQFFKSKNANILYEGKFLQMTQGCPGIPWMHWCGPESQECNCLILEHLGCTVEELLGKCGGVFSMKTVVLLGIQLVEMIEVYHFKELVHRRICPHSLQMGKGKKNHLLFFNDLLNSRKYIDTKTGEHIPNREALGPPHNFTIFSSFKTLSSQEPSRRDDIESIILTLIYLFKGTLPWGGKEKFEDINDINDHLVEILKIRKDLPNSEICQGLPAEFLKMLDHATQLEFTEKPDYSFLKKQLRKVMKRNRWKEDYIFDWVASGGVRYQEVEHLNLEESPVYSEVIAGEKEFIEAFYVPFEGGIDVNQVESKWKERFGGKQGREEEKQMKSEMKPRAENRSNVRNKDDKCQLF